MKKIELDKDLCIGCGACMEIDKDVFGYGSDGLSELKKEIVDENNSSVLLAVESCPTGAIKLSSTQSDNKCSCT